MEKTNIHFKNYTTVALSNKFLAEFCLPQKSIYIETTSDLNLILALIAQVNLSGAVFNYDAASNHHLESSQISYLNKFQCHLDIDEIKERLPSLYNVILNCFRPKILCKLLTECYNQLDLKLASSDDFIKRIDNMLEGWDFSVKELPNGICLAGGSIVTALCKLNPEIYQNINIWVYGKHGTHNESFINAVNFLMRSGDVVCAVNKSVCTFVKPGARHNIQLIYTNRHTPEEIVNNFDLPYLRNYYVGGSEHPEIYPKSRSILEDRHFKLNNDKIEFSRLIKTLSYGLVITNMSILRPSLPDDCPLLRDIDNVDDNVLQACKFLVSEWKQRPEWQAVENRYIHLGIHETGKRAEFLVSKILSNLFVTSVSKHVIDKFAYEALAQQLYVKKNYNIESLEDIPSDHKISGLKKVENKFGNTIDYYIINSLNCYTTTNLKLVYILNDWTPDKIIKRGIIKNFELLPDIEETVDLVFAITQDEKTCKFINKLHLKIIEELEQKLPQPQKTKDQFCKLLEKDTHGGHQTLTVRASSKDIKGIYSIGKSYRVTFSPSELVLYGAKNMTRLQNKAISIELHN